MTALCRIRWFHTVGADAARPVARPDMPMSASYQPPDALMAFLDQL